jgi:type IV secretion system protein VirB4
MSYDRKFRPQIGHWTEHVGINQDGSVATTLHIAGQNAELMAEGAHVASRQVVNQLALQTTHPRLQWWQHFTRCSNPYIPPLQPCTTWWAQSFDAAVAEHCMGGLYRNDLFFTLLLRPRQDIAATLLRLKSTVFQRGRLSIPSATAIFLEEFEDIVSKTINAFAHLGVKRLGFRDEDGVWFSEMWEAHHLIANGFFRPIPLASGTERAGRQIFPVRPIFGHRDFQLLTEGFENWGAILGLINYPGRTHPLMWEKLGSANFDFTGTNSVLFTSTQKAINRLDFKQKQFDATQDARSQSRQLSDRKDDLQSSLTVHGTHHFSLTVRARSQAQLDNSVWKAEELIGKAGATIGRYDSKALMAAFYAQVPGNARWRVRRGGVPLINFASFAALNNVPTGTPTSRWGGPFFYLRTSANTAVPYHVHVTGDPNLPAEDVASWTTTGGMGSGKTAHNARKMVAGQRVGARSIVFDKDCGVAPTVLACDGEYFVLASGVESGVAPLKGLKGTPEDVVFLHQFLLGLIESDGHGSIETADDEALGDQIGFQMTLPVELRAIDGIWPLLGSGAGARLRKWSRSGRLGWAFDGHHDRINMQAGMLGFDTTDLQKNALVCEPMLAYLFYRIQGIVYQKKPLLISLEECWQTIGKAETTGSVTDNKRFVGLFNDQSKTIRKNEGAIGLITQSPSDLLASAMVRSIQQNMPTKEFFGDREAQWVDLVDGFSLTPKEFHIVKMVLPSMRHAMLIKRTGQSFIARNDMSGIASKVTVLSGRRSTYDLCRALQEKYGGESKLWVPHYEILAPLVVKNPHLDVTDLVENRTRYVKERIPA